ncbi:MAG TPA: glutamyl-tRNA reductase [Bryobacteraceae bacterium]|nr:glutamyl-tRNA reductase [Bryobacteraceae bacterium]
MKLHVTGLNHRTAPVELRERLAFDPATLPVALRALRGENGVQESLILSTCNRVEIVVATDEKQDANTQVAGFLERAKPGACVDFQRHFYHFEDRAAIHHLFRVASSLDSMVVGEPQILGQLKDAWSLAKEQGVLGQYLDTVLTRAFNVAKRVRTETTIGESAVSVSFAAVELAREIFGSLEGCGVLLIGAGKMSELAARHLHRSGASPIFVTNRTRARAEEMALLFNGAIIDYDAFLEAMPDIDIVIASSGAPHYILTEAQMRQVRSRRKGRPIFLIDIAVPRNIEPSVNSLENVFLYDIDDLGRVVEQNRKGREAEAEAAERIIAEEVDKLLARLKEREAVPVIVALQEQLETIRQSELQRMRGRLGPLSPQQEEAIDALTRGLIAKIAHGPITEIRRGAAQTDGWQLMEQVRRMFKLELPEE